MKKSKTLSLVLKELKAIAKMSNIIELQEGLSLEAALMDWSVKFNNSTEHTVFCNYSGHIDSVRVDVHVGGWISGEISTFNLYTRVDSDLSPEEIIQIIYYGIWLKEEKNLELDTDVLMDGDYEFENRKWERRKRREALSE